MSSLVPLLSHTPLFVWAILAVLLWQGWRSLHRRTRPVWSMVLVPVVFAGAELLALWRAGLDAPGVLLWFACCLAACPLGRATGPRRESATPTGGPVVWAGSRAPLVRNLCLFAAHYLLSATQALHPDAAARLALGEAALSGATVGYVVGWSLTLLRSLRRGGGDDRTSARP